MVPLISGNPPNSAYVVPFGAQSFQGFRVQRLGLWVVGGAVSGKCRMSMCDCHYHDNSCGALGYKVAALGFRVWRLGLRVWRLGFRR